MLTHAPVNVIKGVGDSVDDAHSVFFGQRHHRFVSAQTVGLCVVLVRQLRYLPLGEQFGEHVFRLPPQDEQPGGDKCTSESLVQWRFYKTAGVSLGDLTCCTNHGV